jgi:hypothetical protein
MRASELVPLSSRSRETGGAGLGVCKEQKESRGNPHIETMTMHHLRLLSLIPITYVFVFYMVLYYIVHLSCQNSALLLLHIQMRLRPSHHFPTTHSSLFSNHQT